MQRQQALENLLAFNGNVAALVQKLGAFPWDSEVALVVLTRQHAASVLQRYLHRQLDEHQLEMWANAIEGREDIDFENGYEEVIGDVIHHLANPLLTETITLQKCQQLLKGLMK